MSNTRWPVPRRTLLIAALALSAGMPAGAAAQAPNGARAAMTEPAQKICPICHNAYSPSYAQRAGGVLMRGAMNTAFGWTELVTHPAEEVKSSGDLLAGVGSGVGRAAKRTFLGIGELFTFWVPKGRQGYLTLNTDCPICMGLRTAPSASPTAPQDTAKKN